MNQRRNNSMQPGSPLRGGQQGAVLITALLLLLVLTIPVMLYNIRRFRAQEELR